jgi:hypothetical protein
MEDLRKVDNIEHAPIKGDNVILNSRLGYLLDDEFNQILWIDNEEIENWIGGWSSFLEAGGHILVI